MENRSLTRIGVIVSASLLFCVLASSVLSAQTLTTLVTFNGTNGSRPGALIQGANGNFFGITNQDGVDLGGTLFEMTASGKVTAQYDFNDFDPTDGAIPVGGLVQAANGNFYGTTGEGGTGLQEGGTVFQLADGKVTTVHNFCSQANCTDGEYPNSGLIQAGNGSFYGTTYEGGANKNCGYAACGIVFEITSSGQYSVLYNFCSLAICADGETPFAGLVEGRDGNLYGVTWAGGNTQCGGSGCGTVFKLTPEGKLTTLHIFCNKKGCPDGAMPGASLVQGNDGNFYGTTTQGGTSSSACFANNYGCGTTFKITPSGEFTTLYVFCSKTNCTDGAAPDASLIQGLDGNFYGTTYFGGANGPYVGTVFQMTPAGHVTNLYSFCSQPNCADGGSPEAALLQTSDGKFYGTTSGDGGDYGFGTVFSLEIGAK